MIVVVTCETLLLVALTVLVVGLLRSHAEILRRLGPASEEGSEAGPGRRGAESIPQPERRAQQGAVRDIVGVAPGGDALKVGLDEDSPPTLLAFLSSGCSVCERFWEDLRSGRGSEQLPVSVRLIAVTKDLHEESPSRIRALAPQAVAVLMSSAAWRDYRVPAAPYFVYVERGRVHGEGSASSWGGIGSLLRDAIEDHAGENGGERRTSEIDRVLASAGIGPGHPSLYPSGQSGAGAPSEGPR